MLTASQVVDHTHDPADTITLNETDRHRRRIALVSDGGIAFLLDLPKARLLRHGEGLVLDDGRVIEVRAEPEALMKITARDDRHLLNLAWQIGNRHLAAEVHSDYILLRYDEVIKQMLEGLEASVESISGPFNPVGGAYGDDHHPHG